MKIKQKFRKVMATLLSVAMVMTLCVGLDFGAITASAEITDTVLMEGVTTSVNEETGVVTISNLSAKNGGTLYYGAMSSSEVSESDIDEANAFFNDSISPERFYCNSMQKITGDSVTVNMTETDPYFVILCEIHEETIDEEGYAIASQVVYLYFANGNDSTGGGTSVGTSSAEAEQCITSLLSEGVTATNCLGGGYFGTFTGGISKGIAIDKGVILATSGGNACAKDSDLEALMDYEYGGDTAILQFDMIASGELLNFNYVFSSKEFDQSPSYNDVFGLFVSVNGGSFENIAKLPNGKDVTITNLRAGASGTLNNYGKSPVSTTGTYDYFKYNSSGYYPDYNIDEQYGVSNKFNAQKIVKIGDKVTVKFVIADVSDDAYDSAVYIEAGSLSFNAPGAKLDCKSETIYDLEEGTYYVTVIADGTEYTFNVTDGGEIPLTGTDSNGNEYDFIGKTISVVQDMGSGEVSDAAVIAVPARPDAPSNVTEEDVELLITDKTVTVTNPQDGLEYIIVSAGTAVTPDMWDNALSTDATESFVFTTDSLGDEFDTTKPYVIYVRVASTDTTLKSESSDVSINFYFASHEHNWSAEWTTNATHHWHECTNEGCGIETAAEMGGYAEHTFGDWVITKEATAETDGEKERKCECGETETAVVKFVPEADENTGILTEDTKPEDNACNADIEIDVEDIITDIGLTDEDILKIENGEDISVYLEVENADATVSTEDKTATENALTADMKVGMYLDINLLKKIGNNNPTAITETKQPITITFVVPDKLINTDTSKTRTYKIIRVHNGTATVLDCSFNPATKTASFATDKFSSYAIAYVDTIDGGNNSGSTGGNSGGNTTPTTRPNYPTVVIKPTTPEKDDDKDNDYEGEDVSSAASVELDETMLEIGSASESDVTVYITFTMFTLSVAYAIFKKKKHE